ncbi:CbiX/SirB N-terminal domain-containing protein [Shumkonia mesophila]|uniref:CbiX/SirB N-terminal domain-containing protein n=1 Tax=Shumkonia mesophila TaxID=2838854 RepID=UPI0029341B69|nr:CbiX/SirB N-terminal domain-containing protein [Shumkonia mesophila]
MAEPTWPQAALLLAGHGLAARPEGALSTLRHAEALRARGLFADVRAGFLRQEPELAATLAELTQPRVYVVPMLASKGYIADVVMARRLNLEGPVTWRPAAGGGQELCFCEPVGAHPRIPALLGERVAALCRRQKLAPAATEVILVGHGTPRHPSSSERTREVADMIAKTGIAARVRAMFLDEEPRIDGWKEQSQAGNVIVAPFLIANWYHGSQDLPGRLGLLTQAGEAAPSLIDGRRLWYMSPLGEEPEIADLALAMVEKFDAERAM